MPQFVIVLLILFGGYWLVKSLVYASPAQIRGMSGSLAGIGLIAAAGFLALRGGLSVAIPVLLTGLGLLGKQVVFPNGFPWNQKKPGQKSRVTTSLLSMELDHDTGDIGGEVLSGTLRGRALSSLSDNEIKTLHDQCGRTTDQSRELLESWLDRAKPDWRENWSSSQGAKPSQGNAMSHEEALEVLGLNKGASASDIRTAHRRLMKQYHPDHGGSGYFAAKINQAKDILLHRAK
jgi:DnaJ domain